MITSPAGAVLAEQARQLFAALVELDKHNPHEVTQICASMASHLRSFHPQAMVSRSSKR
jgi:hypothetical protein